MASRKVKSGGSLKSRKGNVFEYDTAYSLKELGWDVERIDDNTKGIDLIARFKDYDTPIYVECKNRQDLSWSKLVKIWKKTRDSVDPAEGDDQIVVVFKSNRQPTLVMLHGENPDGLIVEPFELCFGGEWKKRPKGYKLWRK